MLACVLAVPALWHRLQAVKHERGFLQSIGRRLVLQSSPISNRGMIVHFCTLRGI